MNTCPAAIVTAGLINNLIIKSLHLRSAKRRRAERSEQTAVVQYQPLTDVVWWMLCVHLLAPTSGQHVCLVVDHTPQSLYLTAPWHEDISRVPHTATCQGHFYSLHLWWLLCPFIWRFRKQLFISKASVSSLQHLGCLSRRKLAFGARKLRFKCN